MAGGALRRLFARGTDRDPQFGGEDVPCLVFLGLAVLLSDGRHAELSTAQAHEDFSLCLGPASADIWKNREDSPGFRTREVGELPVGEVSSVISGSGPVLT